MHTVVLPVGADSYAVPIEWVREVLAAPAVTPLVTAPPVVLGLVNLRGEIVPLLDAAVLLGVGTTAKVAYAAVMQTQHGPAALAVTGLPRRADLEALSGRSDLYGTAGIYHFDDGLAVLLDLAALLTPERLSGHEVRASPSTFGLA